MADDQSDATLRDRIRRAVCEAEGFMWNAEMLEPDDYGEVADAVLTVLPELAAAAVHPQESCGAHLPHATHKFMRGLAVHRCPGQGRSSGRPELDHPDERRERYAAAIGAKGIHNAHVIRLAADAAMTVADAEYRAYDRWAQHVEAENARLRARAEAAEAKTQHMRDEETREVHRLRAELAKVAR